MIEPKCPFCGGKCTIQLSYGGSWEYVRNWECDRCHGVFREVYRMTFARLETLRKPIRRADNGTTLA